MKLICFCGDVSEHVHGALYCRNSACPEYLNIVEGTGLLAGPTETEVLLPPERRLDDNIPFSDHNCAACANLK